MFDISRDILFYRNECGGVGSSHSLRLQCFSNVYVFIVLLYEFHTIRTVGTSQMSTKLLSIWIGILYVILFYISHIFILISFLHSQLLIAVSLIRPMQVLAIRKTLLMPMENNKLG